MMDLIWSGGGPPPVTRAPNPGLLGLEHTLPSRSTQRLDRKVNREGEWETWRRCGSQQVSQAACRPRGQARVHPAARLAGTGGTAHLCPETGSPPRGGGVCASPRPQGGGAVPAAGRGARAASSGPRGPRSGGTCSTSGTSSGVQRAQPWALLRREAALRLKSTASATHSPGDLQQLPPMRMR